MAIGNFDGNPGDLLAGSGNWQGLTGSVGANGLQYASFSSPAYGVRALAIDLRNAINSGYNTVSALVYHFLGTSSNNQANPHVASYLSAVEQGSGLSGSVTASNVPALVQGIIKGEGTTVSSSDLSQGLGMAGFGMTTSQSALAGAVNTSIGDFNTGLNFLGQHPMQGLGMIGRNILSGVTDPSASIANFNVGAVTIGQATADTASQAGSAVSGIGASVSSFLTSISSQALWVRIAFLVVGILLFSAAIFAFLRTNTVQTVASAT